MVTSLQTEFGPTGKPLASHALTTSALVGLDAHPISVEVCTSRGPSFFQLVGLAEASVREARVRVASALARSECCSTSTPSPSTSHRRICARTAPGSTSPSRSAIARRARRAAGSGRSTECSCLGELSLDGALRPVRGVLPQLAGARSRGVKSRDRAGEQRAGSRARRGRRGARRRASLEASVAHFSGGASSTVPGRPAAVLAVASLRHADDLVARARTSHGASRARDRRRRRATTS